MASKKFYFLICALFITLLCIGAVSAFEDTNDNITAVSDDGIVVDEVVSEVESNDDSISVNADEQKGDVDDSASTLKANQENISAEDESAPTLGNNNDVVLSDSADGLNHVYVSPNGEGNGSEGNPTSLNNAIANIQDNSVVHMTDGNYTFDSVLTISVKNNISIVADNPGNVVITGGSSSLATLFSLEAVNNFNLKNIIFKDITFKTNLIKSASKTVNKVQIDPQNFNFEDCSFINCTTTSKSTSLIFIVACVNFSMKNCYFADNNLAKTNTNMLSLNIIPLYNRSSIPHMYNKKSYCNIYNCTFGNNTCSNYLISFQSSGVNIINSEITVSGCNFIDNYFSKADIHVYNAQFSTGNANTGLVYSDPEITTIVNCNFSSNDNLPAIIVDSISSEGLIFEDNFVKSNYGIQFSDSSLKAKGSISILAAGSQVVSISMNGFYLGKLNSIAVITVSNGDTINVTAGETITLFTTIVDNMGNAIRIPNLRLVINGSEYAAIFNNGVYETEYTVPDTSGLLDIDVNYTTVESVSKGYSYIDKQQHDTFAFSLLNSRMCEVNYASLFVKPALNMTLDNISNVDYGENVTVNVNVYNLESGNLTYIIKMNNETIKSIVSPFSNNVSSVTLDGLSAGDYTLTVVYAEDDNFGTTSIMGAFSVAKVNSTIELITDPTVPVWDSINVQAIVPTTATGNVTFRLNNETVTVAVNDGVAEAIFDGLTEGSYTIYAVYDGDGNYNPSEEVNTTIDVTKVDSALDLTYTAPIAGEDVIITIAMNNDINDNVTITVNDNSEVIALTNGSATYTIPSVSAGEIYTVQVDYNGSERYNPVADSITFTVQKANTTVDLSLGNITVGEDVELIIKLAEDINDNVTISVDGIDDSVKLTGGSAVYTIKAVTAGIHNVLVNFEGNSKYNGANASLAFNVEKLNTTLEANADPINVGDDAVIIVTVDSNATGSVIVDNNYYGVISQGSATVTIPNLANGTYTFTVVYSGDEKYNRNETTVTVTVNKLETSISCEPVITVYGSNDYLIAKLTDENNKAISGVNVTVELNGTKNYLTYENGTIKVPLRGLTPNTYEAIITFAGNGMYIDSNATAKVIIAQAPVSLNANYTVSVLNDGFAVNIVVNTDPAINGNLTIKFNGGEYPVEVVNGTANFTSDKVYANTYATDIIYPGSGEYENSSATVNALVKPTSVTQLNTFNYYYYNNDMGSDSEKGISQIKVVDSDGNPIKKGLVTITIMNKYKLKVRTDANGVAKFTKAYKPGTYSVTAEHNNKTTKLGNLVLKSVVNLPKVSKVSKSAKSTTIKITLKGTSPLKGKTVVVNLMKVNYKVKTDNNGVALFKVTKDMVSKLAVGKTYKIRATYRMDSVAQSIQILK